jgi:hypothetical protein
LVRFFQFWFYVQRKIWQPWASVVVWWVNGQFVTTWFVPSCPWGGRGDLAPGVNFVA